VREELKKQKIKSPSLPGEGDLGGEAYLEPEKGGSAVSTNIQICN